MATKKISELPLVNRVSGSQVAGGSVLPIVIGGGIQGTTNQISVEDFSLFVNAYNATTGSNTFIGNQTVTGNVSVSGRLTVNELVAQYETSSILFSTGSTKLGDQLTDKHEFTGSTNLTGSLTATGFITLNGQSLNNAFDRIHQTTHSLQLATSSLQAHSASVDAQLLRLQQTTQSLHVATASLQAHSASVDAQLLAIQQTTQSLQVATASLNAFTASQDARNFIISQFTSSTDAHIVGISDFTSSQLAVNLSNSIYTASVDNHIVGISDFTSSQLAVNLGNSIYTASVDSHIVGISTYTSSVRDTLARVHQATASIQATTASINSFTSSTNAHIVGISTYTSSNESWKDGVRGEVSKIEAWTASLDSLYATDAQLYQLYQATRSLELHSGSMIGVTNGLMAYTASNSTLNTGLRGEVDGIEAYTASLKGQAIVSSSTQVQNYDVFALNSNLYTATGSLIGITNGLMAFTAALDTTYATDAQLYQLYQATRSIELHSGSMVGITNGLMAYTSSNETWKTGVRGEISAIEAWTASLDSTYATDAQLYQLYAETASMKGEIAGIESYTASLKAAAIVSSSTQIQNYDVFALNSNLYTSTGSMKGEIAGIEAYTASLKGAIVVDGTNVEVLGTLTAQEIHTTYVTSSVLFQSGSTKFGNSSDDTHEFTGSKFEVYNSNASGTMYAVVKNNRARNAAIKTTTTNGSFIAGTSIGTDAFQYQIYDEVEGVNRVTINSQGGTTLQGAVTASQTLTATKVAIGSTVTPTIPLEVYGQQKWFTTTGDGSELRGLFNPGGAADDAQLTLYKADGTTEGIKFNANGNSHINGGNLSIGNSTSISTNENSILIGATNSTNIGSIGSVSNYTNNGYYNGSTWKYINSLAASNYYQGSGTHTWRVAASGTAGNDITWKDVFSINNSGQITNTVSGSNGQFILYQQQASYNTDAMSYFHNNANASTSWNFLKMFSGYPDNTQDVEFVFRGDGNGYADTGWTTPAADYAEYFESLNGEALPVGSTVVLVGDKIRVATESDTNIIGVVRPKGAALFLGNNEAQKWNGKYLKDDYGAYILDENGHRTLNPNYDSELTYVSRENRVEWNVVGLIGQIPITKGQVVNPNWIKMKDISSTVEEWLVK